jgi:glycerol-3-phosphate dehydrogenase
MLSTTVLIIGGGITGVGILRDLSMRGINCILVEQQDLSNGASSHYHGLLHSGGRYAVKDPEAAIECIKENMILKKIAKYCIEDTGGYFVRTKLDNEDFENKWVEACNKTNIPIKKIEIKEFLKKEPNVNGDIISVYEIPDAAVDGFRLVWQNVASATKYGGKVLTYTKVTNINVVNGKIVGADVINTVTGEKGKISCDIIINATGSWANKITQLVDININIQPDKGTLVVFNHRICNGVVNRLRPSSDGDIFVPHGTVTILGTTSKKVDDPEDTKPTTEEVKYLLSIATAIYTNIYDYRILRAFAGTRPLYIANNTEAGRNASRGFAIINHQDHGIDGFYSIVGGKLTTYRLMAEKMSDVICERLGNNNKCTTANENLIEDIDNYLIMEGKKVFPSYSNELAAARLGFDGYLEVLNTIKNNPDKKITVCECENVTIAETEYVIKHGSIYSLNDIRRKTRIGMGTCQGSYCTLRTIGVLAKNRIIFKDNYKDLIKGFIKSRWRGIRPVLWGTAIKEIELTRKIYEETLNINGEIPYEEL